MLNLPSSQTSTRDSRWDSEEKVMARFHPTPSVKRCLDAAREDTPILSFRQGRVVTRGKVRRLTVANNDLTREFMKWYAWFLNKTTRFPSSVHGSCRGRSPVTCAKSHLALQSSDSALLRVDVESCFDRLTEVMKFQPHAFNPRDLRVIEELYPGFQGTKISDLIQIARRSIRRTSRFYIHNEICTWILSQTPYGVTGLSIGPWLLNVHLAPFDLAMQYLCKGSGYVYTRYVDDVNISGKNPKIFLHDVRTGLSKFGFNLKDKKTRYYRKGRGRIVTGVTVESGSATLSRQKRRRIRAMIHRAKLSGDKQLLSQAAGHVAWATSIGSSGQGLARQLKAAVQG